MKRKVLQKVICLILSASVLLGLFGVTSYAVVPVGAQTNSGTAATLDEMVALLGTSSYAKYSEHHDDGKWDNQLQAISIDVTAFTGDGHLAGYLVNGNNGECLSSQEANPSNWKEFDAQDKNVWNETVYLPATGSDGKSAASTTWRFTVDEHQLGLYYLQIEYYNCKITTSETGNNSSVSAIQRKLKIDGKVPFDEVSSITLDKHWVYDNVSVSDPTPVTSSDKYRTPGTYVEYETVKRYKGDEAWRNGYYKYSTRVYDDNGTLMKEVSTYKINQDINGNSMTPSIKESSVWSTYICNDSTGYYDGYFAFLFDEAKDYTITLEAEREPMIIKSITLVPASGSNAEIISYEEYLKRHENKADATGDILKIEAEFPTSVSDSSVAPSNSNDSAINYPISAAAQLFNVIGETGYSSIGQWASYSFTVNQSGMYNLSMRFLQEALQGMFVCRTLKISGGEYGLSDGSPAAPFNEAQLLRFGYDNKWQSELLGYYVYRDKNGNTLDSSEVSVNSKGKFVDSNGDAVTIEKVDCKLYFEKGVEYTLYFECSLGDLKEYIERAEISLNNLNESYLKILQRTGSDPDVNTNYKFQETMPEVLISLRDEAIELTKIKAELESLCGTSGSHIATLDTIARILDIMGANGGRDIAANMSNLKTYLGTLGTWINDSKQSTIVVDSICVVPADTDDSLPKAKAGFFRSLWFEISSFIYSFFTKYDQMGLTKDPGDNAESVSVWFASGRDQASIWRSMVDATDGFTNLYGTAVSLKLVTGGTLLPSILSGNGPDVYMGLSSSDVINYAIRSAVVGVSGNDQKVLNDQENLVFRSYVYENGAGEKVYVENDDLGNLVYWKESGKGVVRMTAQESDAFKANIKSYRVVSYPFNEVRNSFAPAAVSTLELLDVYYGIPNTMVFSMMFYRMDVLGELGLEVPESWEELLAMLPVLQTRNMTIGVSYISALDFMIYQKGGNMWKYTESIYDPLYAGSKIDLDSDIAIEAFDYVCRLYTDYSLPVSYDTANRFRTGEMPIVIGSYEGIYNTLVVYATEIAGLWEFCPLPGSENENEEDGFNYDSLATVGATVILNGCDDMLTAWQFAQWQTSASVQAEYGNRIVALIGPAAKYETANIEAVNDLSWTASEKAAIKDQMANLNAIKNYPGSYIYARYMKFAFLDAYNNGAEPYEAMMSYIPAINAEIARKRGEFNLPVAESAEEALRQNQTD